AIFVYDRCCGQLRSRSHAHIERTVSHEAESALGVFQLPGRNTNIKKRTPDRSNSQLIEKTQRAPEIRLSDREPFAEARQLLRYISDRVRIAVQRQDVGPAFQKRLGMATATACGVYDE